MKNQDYEYWVDEVLNGLDDIECGQLRTGKALWTLHGPKGQKKNQLWKTDPEAEGITKFTDYCRRKFPLMSWRSAYQYMQAYETIECVKLDEEKEIAPMAQSATAGGFLIPKSERALRPLTKLKTEVDKKRAWKIANENKKGERVTSRDTADAVQEVLISNVTELQEAKQMAKEIGQEMKAERELQQYADEGISTKDAFVKVHTSWTALIKGEDDERAITKLANVYVEYLTGKYQIDD